MIRIDLSTAIKSIPDDIVATAQNEYTAPCVIGMMMTPEEREELRPRNNKNIINLIQRDFVQAGSPQQERDLRDLQRLFDRGATDALRDRVKTLKEIYA